jgi:hypothetical protein
MKIALIVLGSVVALLIIVVIIGAILPQEHRASRAATFNASPEKLFALITGPQDWRPDLKSYERGRGADGQAFIRETNKRGEIVTYEIVAFLPPRRYAARIADKGLPYGGQWTYELEPRGSQTVLRITEDGEVYNPIFRFLSRFVIGHTRTIDNYLRALAAQTSDSIRIQD